ncbi:uncharacterized protein LOC121024731 isoform X2 [Herpailurus yagouaroundi]|uniref:uncharacterized protein LOC121024731 isoform X2 n=1 Tax=Herpailurus yagouaroundi TaxID=1608482 RepID=UPI001AD70581|nr:leucine-rich colipase-like protein 1 isoform X2 [Puma yagouaroundi]
MACARRLLLLLYLLPVSLAWRPKTVFHLHKPGVTEALHHPDRLPPGPGPAEGARAGWPAPGGGGSRRPELAAEGAGGRRRERGLPSGGGQPNGHACSKHSECRSRCCVLGISGSELTCRPMTIFLQCQPWRKVSRRPGRGREGRGQGGRRAPGSGSVSPAQREPLHQRRRVPEQVLPRSDRGQPPPLRPPEGDPGSMPDLVTGKLILVEEPVWTREKLSLDLVPAFSWELSLRFPPLVLGCENLRVSDAPVLS